MLISALGTLQHLHQLQIWESEPNSLLIATLIVNEL